MDEHQMKDEALRLALEALGHFEKAGLATLKTIHAITAIKQALEQEKALQALHNENKRLGLYKDAYGQQEQEPVAIIASLMPAERHTLLEEGHSLHDSLYTSPPAQRKPWVGLTDWEREKLRSEADEADAGYTQLIKATEAKLREKNA